MKESPWASYDTAISWLSRANCQKNSSVPLRDQAGRYRVQSRFVAYHLLRKSLNVHPVGTGLVGQKYASHRPSGENIAPLS
jgi:hypothetical protein